MRKGLPRKFMGWGAGQPSQHEKQKVVGVGLCSKQRVCTEVPRGTSKSLLIKGTQIVPRRFPCRPRGFIASHFPCPPVCSALTLVCSVLWERQLARPLLNTLFPQLGQEVTHTFSL